ncbi:MAG TPA: hypothetical protein IAC60_00400 [Candidatus Enterosoma merdigallinarum]|nr:hypothetical protein [Candidatus Enterosoma merdigallinarum]
MKKKLLKLAWLSPCLLFLASCDVEKASGNITETINDAIPNLYITLAQLGAFIVMVVLVIVFGYKPIKKKLDARREYVQKNLEDSDEHLKKAKKAQEEAENNITDSRVKANAIVEAARRQAMEETKQMMDKAQESIDLRKKQGEAELEERKKNLERDTHDQIVKTALDASKEILGRELTQEDNDEMIAKFLEDIDKDEDR